MPDMILPLTPANFNIPRKKIYRTTKLSPPGGKVYGYFGVEAPAGRQAIAKEKVGRVKICSLLKNLRPSFSFCLPVELPLGLHNDQMRRSLSKFYGRL